MKIENTIKAVAHEACVCEIVKLSSPEEVDYMIREIMDFDGNDSLEQILHDEGVKDRISFECATETPEQEDYPLLGKNMDFFFVSTTSGVGNIANGYLYGFKCEKWECSIMQRQKNKYVKIFEQEMNY